jgi:hypothetical protein
MGIIVIMLSALFLALGAVPPLASDLAAARISERLKAPVTVQVQAVPTWQLLAGRVDSLQLTVGATRIGAVPIAGLTLQGGPCALDAPCRLGAEVAIATRDLAPMIQASLTEITASLADTLGVPGAQVTDLAVEMGRTAAVSGRFEALGGLVSLPFRVAGTLARLDARTVGLLAATATVNGQAHELGDLAVWHLPEVPGLAVALDRVTVEDRRLRAWMQLDIADPRALLADPRAPLAASPGSSPAL